MGYAVRAKAGGSRGDGAAAGVPAQTPASRASACPLDADGLEHRLLLLPLLLRERLFLRQSLALLHGLARRTLVVVGLASGRPALLDDPGLRNGEPVVRFG